MRKYLLVGKLTFEEYLVYRLNFVLWRFRSVVSFLTLAFFWLAVYGNKGEFLGYQKAQMLTYVVGISFLRGLVLGSRSVDVAGQIRSGELSRIILRPLDFFKFWLSRDAVDKLLNLFFTTIEITTILLILKFPFYFPSSLINLALFFFATVLAIFLFFFISMALSFSAFWTEEVWATRWLFGIIFLEFFAGAFFPIDVLPHWLVNIINLTPFPYLVFFPMKLWLEQLSMAMSIRAIVVCFVWLVIFYWLANHLWKKGAKNYGAYGG
jgi:ABC-2 type transport system permease protein